MKAVIQRVKQASVEINKENIQKIEMGLLIFLGVSTSDTKEDAKLLAEKCTKLRIFEDEDDKLNLSVEDLNLEIMIISNFTLQADTKKGRRPSFADAAKLPLSKELYEFFIDMVKQVDLKSVQTGEFGADMQVSLINDGPVTLVIDTEEWKRGK